MQIHFFMTTVLQQAALFQSAPEVPSGLLAGTRKAVCKLSTFWPLSVRQLGSLYSSINNLDQNTRLLVQSCPLMPLISLGDLGLT